MTSKNSLTKKLTSPFNLIVLNKENLSSSFHDQMFLTDTIFSVLISRVKLFLIALRIFLMDSYIFFIWYKLIHFSLLLNPAIQIYLITLRVTKFFTSLAWPIVIVKFSTRDDNVSSFFYKFKSNKKQLVSPIFHERFCITVIR